MNLVVQAPCHLVVDLSANPGQTAEGRLDMAAGAAESIVEIEVAEGGVEVVAPPQAHDASAEPDTFRVSARAVDRLGRLDEFVGFPLIILGGVGLIAGGRLAGLILRGRAATLGKGASRSDQNGQAGNGEAPQNRNSWITHPSTHTFPD